MNFNSLFPLLTSFLPAFPTFPLLFLSYPHSVRHAHLQLIQFLNSNSFIQISRLGTYIFLDIFHLGSDLVSNVHLESGLYGKKLYTNPF